MEVALIILFNHNYEKNISILEIIYSNRFDNIYFIMPFYTGSRENVITVYENSFYFQGYISKALEGIKNEKFDHYIVIGDDLILNPEINQRNYKDYFKVNENTGFIPEPFLLNDLKVILPNRPLAPFWYWIKSAIDFTCNQDGIESKVLPKYEEAFLLLKKHNFIFSQNIPWRMFYSNKVWSIIFNRKYFHKHKPTFVALKKTINYFNKKISYPLIGSYSDIIIIPAKSVDKMISYCGTFAALHLFVEIAIPTSMAFSTNHLTTEKKLNHKGLTFWNPEDVSNFEKLYDNSMEKLVSNFPSDTLYIHPIKLSRWK